MTGMSGSLDDFTRELFGCDVSGGGLVEPVHANHVIVANGLTASFNEATKTATISAPTQATFPGWHDLVYTDFTAQPDQVFSADGSVTVGGANCAVMNYARRYSGAVFAVENGSTKGLRLPCPASAYASNTSANTGATTKLFYPLSGSSLYSNITNRTPIRAIARLNRIIGIDNPHELGFVLCLDNPSADSASTTFIGGKTSYGANSTLGNLGGGTYFLGTNTSGFSGLSGRSGNNRQLGFEIAGIGPRMAKYLIAPSAVDAMSNPDLADVYRESVASTTYSGSDLNDDYYTLGNWGVSICSYAGGTTYLGAADITYVSHIRIQAFY